MCCGHRWPLTDCSHFQLRLPFPRGSKSQGGTGWMRFLPIDFMFSSCQFYGATTPSVHLMCQGWVFLITFFMASFVDPSNSPWLFPPYSMQVCIYSIPLLPRAWEGRGEEGAQGGDGDHSRGMELCQRAAGGIFVLLWSEPARLHLITGGSHF